MCWRCQTGVSSSSSSWIWRKIFDLACVVQDGVDSDGSSGCCRFSECGLFTAANLVLADVFSTIWYELTTRNSCVAISIVPRVVYGVSATALCRSLLKIPNGLYVMDFGYGWCVASGFDSPHCYSRYFVRKTPIFTDSSSAGAQCKCWYTIDVSSNCNPACLARKRPMMSLRIHDTYWFVMG